MSADPRLDAANARLATILKNASVSRWPGNRFIAIVENPGGTMPLRFIATTPDECVELALRQFNANES
ncbi:MAG: hypothetical protein ACO1OB_29675 [Archangium sp.]